MQLGKIPEPIHDCTEPIIETLVVSSGSVSTEKMTYAPANQVNRPTPSYFELANQRELDH